MGVEYSRFLIPRPNTLRPDVDSTLLLIERLRRERWLLAADDPALANLPFESSSLYGTAKAGGYFARAPGKPHSFGMDLGTLLHSFGNRDLMVVWPVESLVTSGLRYPLTPLPHDDPNCYYEVQLHFGHDYIYHSSEFVDPFEPEPACSGCGHALEHHPESDDDPFYDDPFYSARLARCCPKCGIPFDPTHLLADARDAWTGEPLSIQGGATYRFAVVVDCGKCFDRRKEHVFDPQFKSLVEQTLGTSTYEVSYIY